MSTNSVAVAVGVAVAALSLAACSSESAPPAQSASPAPTVGPPVAAPDTTAPAPGSDSAIVEQRLAWARARRLDTLPLGEIIAQVGKTFVGHPYTPGTLDPPGPEQLVINLREFDCVTFVENSLALGRVIRAGKGGFAAFKQELERIRYRDGKLNGYPSRLHYFSEWISNNESKGVVKNITQTLGGVRDPEPITFMTEHVASYRQLSDANLVQEIKAQEERLNRGSRYVIPEGQIAAVAKQIQNGDVIAAATNVKGLDVAHTGLALWVNGQLHLMHAPLVGKSVEISEVPLANRILVQKSQDGIMVARPQ